VPIPITAIRGKFYLRVGGVPMLIRKSERSFKRCPKLLWCTEEAAKLLHKIQRQMMAEAKLIGQLVTVDNSVSTCQ
jgi:hypothetical protein